jgi:hypothetical protein
MRLGSVLLGALFAVACSKSSPSSETPAMADARDAASAAEPPDQRSDAMSTSKDPNAPAPSFERGAAITPSADLLAWLDQQTRQVRLPMTLTLTATGAVATATIGVGGEADPIAVELSDLGMGLSLKDRLRKVCKPGATCTVWLVGKWSSGNRLQVGKLDGEVGSGGATHAEVAVE